MRRPLFGLSAAGYRLEGGFNGAGQPANHWTAWERAGKVRPAGRDGHGIWEDPEHAIELAEAAGARALALSVEWARIEPGPGHVDQAALERYATIFASAAARGVTPIAILHDVTHPAWLGEEFWLTPGAPDRFADHVARTVTALRSSCSHWVTLRNPNLVALAGWVDGRHPPRRIGAVSDAWAVVDNFLAAHVLAYAAVHDAQGDAEVLLGLRASSSYDWHRLMIDLLCAPALDVERDEFDSWIALRRTRHDTAAPPADLGDLVWRRSAGATAPFGDGPWRRASPRRAVDLVYRFDAGRARSPSGSNGSSPTDDRGYPIDALLVGWRPPHVTVTPFLSRAARPWESRPDPDGLAEWCRQQAGATPGLPLWVEDGFATRRGAPRSDGWDRRSYVRAQRAALESMEASAGVTIAGYLYYAHEGGGDPTWPDAEFGLGRDAPACRELFGEERPPATAPPRSA